MRSSVPFIPEKRIETAAKSLLEEYASEFAPILKPPVPIEEIIELHVKLQFEIQDLKKLFSFGDVHGAIWFRDRRIAVDRQLDPGTYPSKLGRFHFTLAHELGHWCLHRQYFIEPEGQGSLFDGADEKADYVCRSSEEKLPLERQADFFASRLLMPSSMIGQAWEAWRGALNPIVLSEMTDRAERLHAEKKRRGRYAQGSDDDLVLENACRPLADVFEVSPEAMRYRLEGLGLLLKTRAPSLFE